MSPRGEGNTRLELAEVCAVDDLVSKNSPSLASTLCRDVTVVSRGRGQEWGAQKSTKKKYKKTPEVTLTNGVSNPGSVEELLVEILIVQSCYHLHTTYFVWEPSLLMHLKLQ